MSLLPPGAAGLTMRTGLTGKLCAEALPQAMHAAMPMDIAIAADFTFASSSKIRFVLAVRYPRTDVVYRERREPKEGRSARTQTLVSLLGVHRRVKRNRHRLFRFYV